VSVRCVVTVTFVCPPTTVVATDEDEVTRLMIGRSIDQYFVRARSVPGAEILRVEGLNVPGRIFDVGLRVHEGEVVGLYGLVGAGRSEIAEAIFGVLPMSGTIYWRGRRTEIRDGHDAVRLGIGLVPEDRKRQGLVLGLGGRTNATLAQLDRVARLGLIQRPREQRIFEDYRQRLRISTTGPEQKALTLSGGNQQKLVIAKWLSRSPKLLILDEPTRGVDVGAKAEIHALIDELAAGGAAVILISSEMPEVLNLSTRILVFRDGRIAGEIQRADASQDLLLRLMAGVDAA